ncbi:polysaccharide deacetylase family protein [Oscillatoria sp. FACHB-1406]|uniref:polysaccharide deacetylase family protein n=1 Tax=Oscillatoria sp. FACHB-1406 TaxID=2692846 RepID=UPI00168902B0|nr:polysaccharide deacetylase family protein [Oscillatoria sp. FACHB-1406]MBD2577539.1 polysaccharide deacetylase family protein [Oscillatoria sp. FACHB-1406]
MLLVPRKLRSLFQRPQVKTPLLKKIFAIALLFCVGLGISLTIFEITTVEVPVLGFHDVIDISNPEELPPKRLSQEGDYTKQKLATFIEDLVRENYWFLSTAELYDYFLSPHKRAIPKEHQNQNPLLLTFDDGYKSAHKNILAIAEDIERRYGKKIKIVWFINPAFLGHHGTKLERISCNDLRTGLERGYYDVQSHGLNHLNLTQIPDKQLDRELKVAKEELKTCTQGLDPDNLVASQIAYPFGAVNARVKERVARYYKAGYLYNSRILRPKYLKDNYLIPRLTIYNEVSVKRLKILAAGGWL